jgi:hypothetical protein
MLNLSVSYEASLRPGLVPGPWPQFDKLRPRSDLLGSCILGLTGQDQIQRPARLC